jgi:hypothetical protein
MVSILLHPPCGVATSLLHGEEKAESFIEGLQKNSPPFGKGRQGGIFGNDFSKNQIQYLSLPPAFTRSRLNAKLGFL